MGNMTVQTVCYVAGPTDGVVTTAVAQRVESTLMASALGFPSSLCTGVPLTSSAPRGQCGSGEQVRNQVL